MTEPENFNNYAKWAVAFTARLMSDKRARIEFTKINDRKNFRSGSMD